MRQTARRLAQVSEYYFSQKLREVRALIQQGHPVIQMGIGSPDLAPAPEVIQAIKESLSDPMAHQYQSYQGLPALRSAMDRCMIPSLEPIKGSTSDSGSNETPYWVW